MGTSYGSKNTNAVTRSSRATALIIIIGSLPALGVVLLGFQFFLHALLEWKLPNDDDAFAASINSLLFSAIVTVLSAPLCVYISSFRSKSKIIIAFSLALIFIPGQVVALGLQYAGSMGGLPAGEATRGFLLFVSIIIYVLPFQLIILNSSVIQIELSEWHAAMEFLPKFKFILYFFRRNISNIVSALIVCFALSFTEGVRSSILAADFFGFGTKMFTPYILSRFTGGGFSEIFHFASTIIYLIALLLVFRSVRLRGE